MFDNWFGKNEGIELIAERLRNGVPYVKAYDLNDKAAIYFKGTGEHIRGTGVHRVYDIHFKCIYLNGHWSGGLSDWQPVSSSVYLKSQLEDLNDSYLIELRDQEGENDPEEVVAWLKKIVSRLKPHQCYHLENMSITNELFSGDLIRLYKGESEVMIPREYIGNRRLIGGTELGTTFNSNRVATFNDEKIKREHRLDTDPKRWYEIKKVASVNDKHAIRLTHRKTAHASVHYFTMGIIADSKAAASRPFYVKELLQVAVDELAKVYPPNDYHLEIFTNAIDFTWDGKTVSVDTYHSTQSKYPASVDTQPLLVYKPLVASNVVWLDRFIEWKIKNA